MQELFKALEALGITTEEERKKIADNDKGLRRLIWDSRIQCIPRQLEHQETSVETLITTFGINLAYSPDWHKDILSITGPTNSFCGALLEVNIKEIKRLPEILSERSLRTANFLEFIVIAGSMKGILGQTVFYASTASELAEKWALRKQYDSKELHCLRPIQGNNITLTTAEIDKAKSVWLAVCKL